MTKQPVVDPLSKEDKKTFRHCESIIKRGVRTFVEVGMALKQIQENQYYRETHSTFDEYCKNRWDMSRAHAYRLIESAKVVEDVAPTGSVPGNEAQARPLSRLRHPRARQDAWKDAQESSGSGPVTAKAVEAAVERQEKKDSLSGVETEDVTDDGKDPMKLTLCPDPDGIASWSWHPLENVEGRVVFFEKRLGAPQYTRPPSNSHDLEDSTVIVCPDLDVFNPKIPDASVEAILEAAEKAPHWTFLVISKNYKRMFSYAYPNNIWAGARISSAADFGCAESEALHGKSGTRFMYCSPLTEELTLAVPHPFQWIVVGGSDPQPDWEHVWNLTAQAVDINIPILWAESLKVRPEYRPDNFLEV